MSKGQCTFDVCDRQIEAAGLCKGHYQQRWSGKEMHVIRQYVQLTEEQMHEAVARVKSGDTLMNVSGDYGVDRSVIGRNFKRITGESVHDYKARVKAGR